MEVYLGRSLRPLTSLFLIFLFSQISSYRLKCRLILLLFPVRFIISIRFVSNVPLMRHLRHYSKRSLHHLHFCSLPVALTDLCQKVFVYEKPVVKTSKYHAEISIMNRQQQWKRRIHLIDLIVFSNFTISCALLKCINEKNSTFSSIPDLSLAIH